MCDIRARKYRQRKFVEQRQRCFYCAFPMWARGAPKFAARFGITLKEASRFKCTAEHKVAQRDGGTSCQDNIVAACQWCNRLRHQRVRPLDFDRYRERVMKHVAEGAWHPRKLHEKMRGLPC